MGKEKLDNPKPKIKLSEEDKKAYLQPANLVTEPITEEIQKLAERYIDKGVTKAMIVLGSPDETCEANLTYLYVKKARKYK